MPPKFSLHGSGLLPMVQIKVFLGSWGRDTNISPPPLPALAVPDLHGQPSQASPPPGSLP